MGTDQLVDVADSLVTAGGEDRISALRDDLLNAVLLRLDTAAAARTSVLSRRWRHVWANLPELSFLYEYGNPASPSPPPNRIGLPWRRPGAHLADLFHRIGVLLCIAWAYLTNLFLHHGEGADHPVSDSATTAASQDCVGAALAAYAAPTLRRLEIAVSSHGLPHATADHVSSWLRFASHRLAGDLQLSLPHFEPKGEIMLPLIERATSIGFVELDGCTLRFHPPRQDLGAFKALTTLRITGAFVDSRELGDTLRSRCPRLKELTLGRISLMDEAAILSIRSDSLERLDISTIHYYGGQLQVCAPKLRTLRCGDQCDFYIAAPMLSELCWDNGGYDPSRQRIVEVERTLRRLEVKGDAAGSKLMQQFSTVHELDLDVCIAEGTQHYRRFMEHVNRLAKCEVLVVSMGKNHALRSTMIHLLRKCSGVRKLVVHLTSARDDYDPCKSGSGCPCSRLENRKADNIVMDLLEEVEVKGGGDAEHKVEVVRPLCNCSRMFQKRVAITVSETTQVEYIGTKISSSFSKDDTQPGDGSNCFSKGPLVDILHRSYVLFS